MRNILNWIAGLNHINHVLGTIGIMVLTAPLAFVHPWYPATIAILRYFFREHTQYHVRLRNEAGAWTPKILFQAWMVWRWPKDHLLGAIPPAILAIALTAALERLF